MVQWCGMERGEGRIRGPMGGVGDERKENVRVNAKGAAGYEGVLWSCRAKRTAWAYDAVRYGKSSRKFRNMRILAHSLALPMRTRDRGILPCPDGFGKIGLRSLTDAQIGLN